MSYVICHNHRAVTPTMGKLSRQQICIYNPEVDLSDPTDHHLQNSHLMKYERIRQKAEIGHVACGSSKVNV